MRILLLSVCFIAALSILIVGLGNALVPLMIAFASAYVLLPVIKFIEARGASRVFATVIVFLAFLAVLLLSFGYVAPAIYFEFTYFLSQLPSQMVVLYKKVNSFLAQYGYAIDYSLDDLLLKMQGVSTASISGLLKSFGWMAKSSTFGLVNIVLGFLNILMIPLFFFYITIDFEKISKDLWSYIPDKFQP